MKIFVSVLLLALATWFLLSPGKATRIDAKSQASVDTDKVSLVPPAPHAPLRTSLSAKSAPQVSSSTRPTVMTESDFIQTLNAADLETVITLNDFIQKLRVQDPSRVAKFFSSRLDQLGSSSSVERGRLFTAANALQSDALLPFWQNLALRKTPAYSNETDLVNAPEPSFDSRVVLSEMSVAVRNLGLISYRDPAAAEILKEIANRPKSNLHSTLIRQYAYEALKEADQVAGMQIIRSLKKDDPLKKRLVSDAKTSK